MTIFSFQKIKSCFERDTIGDNIIMVDKVQNFPDPLSYYIFGQEEIFILKPLAQCLYNFTMYVPDMGIWWV